MKLAIATSVLALGAVGFAQAEEPVQPAGVWADGYVSYKHPDGSLATRDCSLWVPAKGEGEVALKCGEYTASTKHFFTDHDKNGKVTFTVVFTSLPGAPENTMALYSGAYMRGTNQAIYYGDVLNAHWECCNVHHSEWKYVGGFMFSADVK